MSRRTTLARAKKAYVVAARALTSPIAGQEVPSRDHRLRHWVASLPRVYDSLSIAELDVPWWTYRAIEVVDAWLQARPAPIRVFEYGSGASTLWLAKRADEVHSVEHDAEFGAMMAEALSPYPHVSLEVVEPTRPESIRLGSDKEGYEADDFSDYVSSIERAPGPFDLIVIDGRARQACLERSQHHLAQRGIIVFDNSRRARYRSAIERIAGHEQVLRGLTPTLPYPEQTSVIVLPKATPTEVTAHPTRPAARPGAPTPP